MNPRADLPLANLLELINEIIAANTGTAAEVPET